MKKPTLKQWMAVLYKDFLDLRWNGQIQVNFIICLLVTFTFIWIPRNDLPIKFVIGFTFTMVTMFTQGNLIVEEWEQQTSRRLHQKGFSVKDLIFTKTLVTFFMTSVFIFLFILFYRFDPNISLNLLILSFPVVTIMILFGTFIGLQAKNTIDVNLYGAPFAIFYVFLESLLMNNESGEMQWLKYFPNYHLYYGLTSSDLLPHLLIPYLWMFITLLAFLWWFIKRPHYFN